MRVDARLYLVCDAISSERLEAALDGGVDLVQLRMKHAADADILAAAARFGEVLAPHGVPLILNDRPDLVAAAGADGVHIGQDDTSVPQARELVGPDRIVGLSTHTPAQVDAAQDAGVDYFAVGPIFATPTKPGRPAVGTALVAHAAAHASLPFFAIGGLGADTVEPVIAAGARRIAMVRAIADAPDPTAAARALAQTLEARVGAA